MLTIVHQNPVVDMGLKIQVDRKFDEGIRQYCQHVPVRITSVHPRSGPDAAIMDPVEVPRASAPYEIVTIDVDRSGRLAPASRGELQKLIAGSKLVYGQAYGAGDFARSLGIPYIAVVEYDLGTQTTVTTCEIANPFRKVVRGARTVVDYFGRQVPELSRAVSVHCNGYPIYDALRGKHPARLLYLDSRVSSEMVIETDALKHRLAARKDRRLRLLYSGRFAAMKGAYDVVATGVSLLQRGVDFELHLYGQGPEKARMQELIDRSGANDVIQLHSAVPFPTLFEISKSFDVFVCCHVQSDPSCTYLEAHGAGLPIAGYDNRMWSRLRVEAGSGVGAPIGDPDALAQRIAEFVHAPHFDAACFQAREFAARHAFEPEFQLRVADIRRHLGI